MNGILRRMNNLQLSISSNNNSNNFTDNNNSSKRIEQSTNSVNVNQSVISSTAVTNQAVTKTTPNKCNNSPLRTNNKNTKQVRTRKLVRPKLNSTLPLATTVDKIICPPTAFYQRFNKAQNVHNDKNLSEQRLIDEMNFDLFKHDSKQEPWNIYRNYKLTAYDVIIPTLALPISSRAQLMYSSPIV